LPDEVEDYDALVRRVDPDRWLSTRFVADPAARADLLTLYAFDHELARASAVTSTPLLAEIRLTWWLEMLEEAYEGCPVRRHPVAQALAEMVARRSLPRSAVEPMIEARLAALESAEPVSEAEVVYAAALILDPATPHDATPNSLSAAAFPAALPLAARHIANPLLKRLKLVWSMATGNL
jgi:phytoene/squalene synthetase